MKGRRKERREEKKETTNEMEETKKNVRKIKGRRREMKLTSKTCWTSTVVMNPLLSLSNLWKRFLYLSTRETSLTSRFFIFFQFNRINNIYITCNNPTAVLAAAPEGAGVL